MIGIYMILNLKNKKRYIGLSTKIEERFQFHKKRLKLSSHRNKHLQFSWNKYSEENFIFVVLEECKVSELQNKEKYWINHFQTFNAKFGYNKTYGGEFGKLSEDALEKRIDSQRKQKIPQNVRDKISKSLKGRKSPKDVVMKRALSNRKITLDQENEIKEILLKGGLTYKEIARNFNTTVSVIRGVINRNFEGSLRKWKRKK